MINDSALTVQMGDRRGGLISPSDAACPSQAGGWQFFSPRDGFQPGEVRVSCLDWAEEESR